MISLTIAFLLFSASALLAMRVRRFANLFALAMIVVALGSIVASNTIDIGADDSHYLYTRVSAMRECTVIDLSPTIVFEIGTCE